MNAPFSRRSLMLASVSIAALVPLAAALLVNADDGVRPVLYQSEARKSVMDLANDVMKLASEKYDVEYSKIDQLRIPEETWLEIRLLIASKYNLIDK